VDHWVEYSQTANKIFTSPMCHGRPNYLQNLGLLEHITELRENGGLSQQKNESPRKFRQQQVFKAPTRLRELRPKTLEDKDLSGGEDQNVRRRMEICRQALKQRIKENGYHPVHYLRFAADPSSYETTVRNLFTLSHLINRQEVTLVFDTIDQPYIYPKKLKDRLKNRPDHPQLIVGEDDKGTCSEELGNFITTITPEDWRQILDIYQVTQPAIPQDPHQPDQIISGDPQDLKILNSRSVIFLERR